MFGLPIPSILLTAFALVWCGQMVRRLPRDVHTVRTTREPFERAAIVILWTVSVLLGMWTLGTLTGAVRGLATALG